MNPFHRDMKLSVRRCLTLSNGTLHDSHVLCVRRLIWEKMPLLFIYMREGKNSDNHQKNPTHLKCSPAIKLLLFHFLSWVKCISLISSRMQKKYTECHAIKGTGLVKWVFFTHRTDTKDVIEELWMFSLWQIQIVNKSLYDGWPWLVFAHILKFTKSRIVMTNSPTFNYYSSDSSKAWQLHVLNRIMLCTHWTLSIASNACRAQPKTNLWEHILMDTNSSEQGLVTDLPLTHMFPSSCSSVQWKQLPVGLCQITRNCTFIFFFTLQCTVGC